MEEYLTTRIDKESESVRCTLSNLVKAPIRCQSAQVPLIHNVDKPIYLIVDGNPVHKSNKVRNFVESTNGKLKLFYLPPYSPELNPDELVWNYVKYHRIGKKEIKCPDNFKKSVILPEGVTALSGKNHWLLQRI